MSTKAQVDEGRKRLTTLRHFGVWVVQEGNTFRLIDVKGKLVEVPQPKTWTLLTWARKDKDGVLAQIRAFCAPKGFVVANPEVLASNEARVDTGRERVLELSAHGIWIVREGKTFWLEDIKGEEVRSLQPVEWTVKEDTPEARAFILRLIDHYCAIYDCLLANPEELSAKEKEGE